MAKPNPNYVIGLGWLNPLPSRLLILAEQGMATDVAINHEDSASVKAINKNRQDNASSQTTTKFRTRVRDFISFVDLDFKRSTEAESLNIRGKRAASAIQGKNYNSITIPTIPLELAYESASEFAALASLGRNNPFYHYTGSEDSLSFQIDLYSKIASREDVIYWCKWLNSLTKANGYLESPHRVMIVWGKDSRLFEDDVWIVEKAPYKLSQFQTNASLLPQQAYVDITLKRWVDHNLTTSEIVGTFDPYPKVDYQDSYTPTNPLFQTT